MSQICNQNTCICTNPYERTCKYVRTHVRKHTLRVIIQSQTYSTTTKNKETKRKTRSTKNTRKYHASHKKHETQRGTHLFDNTVELDKISLPDRLREGQVWPESHAKALLVKDRALRYFP